MCDRAPAIQQPASPKRNVPVQGDRDAVRHVEGARNDQRVDVTFLKTVESLGLNSKPISGCDEPVLAPSDLRKAELPVRSSGARDRRRLPVLDDGFVADDARKRKSGTAISFGNARSTVQMRI
jgi:hypothetical protein